MSTGLLSDIGEGMICPTGAPFQSHLISRMPMTGALAWEIFVLAGFGWDHHYASVFDATLGNDVIGEMLNLGTGAAQRSHLHAVIIVEMTMIIFDQPPRQVARAMIVDVD